MKDDLKFSWGEFEQKLRKGQQGSFSVKIPPSPCKSCRNASGSGGCHKPVNPEFSTACRRWSEWFYEVWPMLREQIGGVRHV